MVRPQNLVTRDMIHVMHKDLTLRTPNVNTPVRRYAFDDMVVECRKFLDVRMLLGTTILVDTPNADDLVESPESPTTTIVESPASPTTTYEHNLEQAFDLGYQLTPPPNLELERSFGHYDYSTASTSTSSCTNLY